MKKKLNIEVDISEKKYFTSKYNENTLAPELKDYLLNNENPNGPHSVM